MLTAVFLQTHLLGSADAVQMLHRTIISIGSLPINRSIYLQEVRPQKQSTGSGKSKPENTLGKYCTCTMGIVDVRNLSKFPATATVAATFTSAAVMAIVVAVDTTTVFDEAVHEESSDPTLVANQRHWNW